MKIHQLSSENFPPSLKNLKSIAEKWGATTNSELAMVHDQIDRRELLEIQRSLEGNRDHIEDWFYSHYLEGLEMPVELSALKGLIRVDNELSDGPGLSNILEWALDRYEKNPTNEGAESIKKARAEIEQYPMLCDVFANLIQKANLILS